VQVIIHCRNLFCSEAAVMFAAINSSLLHVNLSVAVPKAFPTPGLAANCVPDVRRVILVDENCNSIMALTPYRAMASSIVDNGRRVVPNVNGGLQNVNATDWDNMRTLIQQAHGDETIRITRREWSFTTGSVGVGGGRQNSFAATIAGPMDQNMKPCWIPLIQAIQGDGSQTVWLPGRLNQLHPPNDRQAILIVMETETEIIRSEFAWRASDSARILQGVGGMGGLVDEFGVVHLEGGGTFYSPLYGTGRPGEILYIGYSKENDDCLSSFQVGDPSVDATGVVPVKESHQGEDSHCTQQWDETTRPSDVLYRLSLPSRVQRGEVAGFYYNPSLVKFGLQRVLIVEHPGNAVLCTPMRAVAFLIMNRMRRRAKDDDQQQYKDNTFLTDPSVADLVSTQQEIDEALQLLNRNRLDASSSSTAAISFFRSLMKKFYKEEEEVGSDTSMVQQGWVQFLHESLTVSRDDRFLSVITTDGESCSVGRKLEETSRAFLTFLDTEADLIYGEPCVVSIQVDHGVTEERLGIRFRGGYVAIKSKKDIGEEEESSMGSNNNNNNSKRADVLLRSNGSDKNARKLIIVGSREPIVGLTWRFDMEVGQQNIPTGLNLRQ